MRFAKKDGHVVNGVVYWLDINYIAEFEDRKLVRLTHRSTRVSTDVDPQEILISDAYTPIDHWSDQQAAYQYKKQKPILIAEFFEKAFYQGPWSVRHYTGSKSKDWQEYLDLQSRNFIAQRKNLLGGEMKEAITTAVTKLHADKNREAMAGARQKAQQGLQRQRELRVSVGNLARDGKGLGKGKGKPNAGAAGAVVDGEDEKEPAKEGDEANAAGGEGGR